MEGLGQLTQLLTTGGAVTVLVTFIYFWKTGTICHSREVQRETMRADAAELRRVADLAAAEARHDRDVKTLEDRISRTETNRDRWIDAAAQNRQNAKQAMGIAEQMVKSGGEGDRSTQ